MVNPHGILLKVRMGQSSALAFQEHPSHEQAQVGAIPHGKDPSFVSQRQQMRKSHIHAQECGAQSQPRASAGTRKSKGRNPQGLERCRRGAEGKDGTPGLLTRSLPTALS